jgi:LysR family transcriptional regulator, low CO2-responsive transcriptional regulator
MDVLPHPDWLRAFLAFADTLNFTRAAGRLHLTQPAVHGQVKKLSELLGVPLYQRRGRDLVLTTDGVRTRAFAAEQLAHGRRFMAAVQGRDEAERVTLAAGEGAHLYLLGPVLRALASGLRVRVTDGDATLQAVRSGEAQVGVLAGAPPDELEACPVARVGQHLLLPADAPLAQQGHAAPTDLTGAALVVPPRGRPHRTTLEVALSDVDWQVAVEARGWPVALRFVELGLGWAIVNDCVPAPQGFAAVPMPTFPTLTYYAIRRRGALHGPGAQALWSALLALDT